MSALLPDGPTLGGWCHIPGGFAAEVMGAAGFDWCLVDRQHGLIGEAEMFDMLRALSISGTPSFVRVSQTDHGEIGRALDAGAHGVVVPQVGSPEEAREAVTACRYAPTGGRSIGPSRLKLYGRADPQAANSSVVCLPMIESRAGLDAVEEIADVEGVDGLFVGPSDLRLDLGIAGEEFDAVLRRIARACTDRGKLAGAFGMGAARIPGWIELGYSFLAVDSDASFLLDAARAALSESRRGLPPAATRG
jgi:4-hydroxy-2-oxoheptanedioate aldolase